MLANDLETICFIVIKARAFDAKVAIQEPDPGSNPGDEGMREVLEDYPDDPVEDELTAAIDSLNEDQQIELVALSWMGRGDYDKEDWPEAVAEARAARSDHTAGYLLGMPLVGDYLENGLATLGYSCEEFEREHL